MSSWGREFFEGVYAWSRLLHQRVLVCLTVHWYLLGRSWRSCPSSLETRSPPLLEISWLSGETDFLSALCGSFLLNQPTVTRRFHMRSRLICGMWGSSACRDRASAPDWVQTEMVFAHMMCVSTITHIMKLKSKSYRILIKHLIKLFQSHYCGTKDFLARIITWRSSCPVTSVDLDSNSNLLF